MRPLDRIFYSMTSMLLITGSIIFSSCMPSTTPRTQSNASTGIGNGTTPPATANPVFPLTGIFLQEGATLSTTQITIPMDFNDSFLIRGEALSTYLKTIPNTTRFCLVAKYPAQTASLVVSAKAKSFTDLSKGTTEFYLQVEPSQLSSNQNDCLTPNLTSTLIAETPGLAINFDLATLCANCSTAVTSNALKLYFVNGEQVPSLNFASLKLNIAGAVDTSQGNTCSTNSACTSRGFSCCLQNQCVTDKAVKQGVNLLDPSFLVAQQDVLNNPNRYSIYPQYYYVCETTTPSNPDTGPGTDPLYEAQVRLIEQTQLYNCLNLVQDEYSYCTVKYPAIKNQIQAGFTFTVKNDDMNFSSIMSAGFVNKNNITKIYYAGRTLYEEGATLVTPLDTAIIDTISAPNDSATTAQSIKFKTTANVTGNDDNLYISFRVDGTCEQLSTSLARCSKTYIQGNVNTSSTYYHPSGNTFRLPSYANVTDYSVLVKLSDTNVAIDDIWTLNAAGKYVQFNSTVQPNQKVQITYYVTNNVSTIVGYKKDNQEAVNTMCGCASSTGKCNLAPKKDSAGVTLVGYDCVYPSTATENPPANQTVYVSSRNMPIRYYDAGGVNYDDDVIAQGQAQEGGVFKYTNNDTLKPAVTATGTLPTRFNEIYGSIIQGSAASAKPAKTVKVKKDTTYNIYTNSGTFSSCSTCGNDYYSALQKIFPQNFYGVGGGYTPDNYVSARINSTSIYRSDDLLYGRACFLPATMIPWTHKTGTDVTTQRRNRLEAQHFLFANGYQRDWYGFDYGSIIGSFDGVTWFSIGNQRSIKASTNRLYLAVNSYFGDLNIDNSFNITVSESTSSTINPVTSDSLSDGAECQKSHFCSTDNDCIKQVGYEYTCQNVVGLNSEWPVFNAGAQETIGSVRKSLSSITGGLNAQNRRCVYRGRGSLCQNNLGASSTFNDSSLPGLLSCSSNNYCAQVSSSGKFNTSIARYANTPLAQNLIYNTNLSDTFGLGARIIGRPFDFYGTGSASSVVSGQLNNGSVCIPGKELNASSTTYDMHSRTTTSRPDSADKNYGIGRTLDSTQSLKFYGSCPAVDTAGIYTQWTNRNLTDPAHTEPAITQNLSTAHLNLAPITSLGVYNSVVTGAQVTGQGYQRNACLRAPGAACFSDQECAPSDFIATKFRNASGLSALLNESEIAYWKEDLICGNPNFKYLNASLAKNPSFDVKKNFCCRDISKDLTVSTQMITRYSNSSPLTNYVTTSDFNYCDPTLSTIDKRAVAGHNKPINSYSRYSRIHTIYDKMTCDPTEFGRLKAPMAQSNASMNFQIDISFILGQYETLDTLNSRTCCSTHWVRNFDTSMGGGHTWVRNKTQIFDKSIFKHLSWRPQDPSVSDTAFECEADGYLDASCEVKNFTDTEVKKYLDFFGAFELTGIPQVAIPNASQVFKLVNDSQQSIVTGVPVNDTLDLVNSVNHDYDNAGEKFISAASDLKMDGPKKVFSSDKFNCCLPTGIELPTGSTAGQCCTGNIANTGASDKLRCCLPDFTDVSVYLNRYVSSEGRGLSDSAYDEKTGYIISEATVMQKAANVCCSGKAAYGVAISTLHIPLTGGTVTESTGGKTRRFVYREDSVDNNTVTGAAGSVYDAGLKWNNHVYCVPTTY